MHVAIVGATGVVGREMCAIIEQRRFPVDDITCLASGQSAGNILSIKGKEYIVEELTPSSFQDVDLAFFAIGSEASQVYARHAREAGTTIIDNSSAFRMDPEVPLVIPEINSEDLKRHQGLIANPNCSTIVMAMAIWPLHQVNPLRRIVVSTYQAASGAGAQAMQELQDQTQNALSGQQLQPRAFPYQCAFNLFSHESPIDETGYNQEERKITQETHKIFHDQDIQISATCIRVPVFRAHSESIHLTFQNPMIAEQALNILEGAPGIRLMDDRTNNCFPMPIDASGADEVLVGRIRQDTSDPAGCCLQLFACGDQLRKGAALNAVQIAEELK